MERSEAELLSIVGQGESLVVEFKSDSKRFRDDDLVSAVVAMANTQAGILFLGVEDNGKITGLHSAHQDVAGMAPMISNKTAPNLNVSVRKCELHGKQVAVIEVPKANCLTSSSDGRLYRRKIKHDGTPEAVPIYPHELARFYKQSGWLYRRSYTQKPSDCRTSFPKPASCRYC